MKVIMENYRKGSLVTELTLLEICAFNEEEIAFLNEAGILNEGVVDFGRNMWDSVKGIFKSIDQYKDSKIIPFLRKAREAYVALVDKARQKKLISKSRAKLEKSAMRLLTTKKHIKLGVLIFTALIKAAGGLALDAIASSSQIYGKLKEAFDEFFAENPDIKKVIKILLGAVDSFELGKIISLFQKFRADLNSPIAAILSTQQGASDPNSEFALAEALKKIMEK